MESDKLATCSKSCYFHLLGKTYGHVGSFCRDGEDPKYNPQLPEPLNFKGAFPGFPCERGYTESQLAARTEEEQTRTKTQAKTQNLARMSQDSRSLPKCTGVAGIPFIDPRGALK